MKYHQIISNPKLLLFFWYTRYLGGKPPSNSPRAWPAFVLEGASMAVISSVTTGSACAARAMGKLELYRVGYLALEAHHFLYSFLSRSWVQQRSPDPRYELCINRYHLKIHSGEPKSQCEKSINLNHRSEDQHLHKQPFSKI